ncbi:MAG: hypothetical protein PH343_08595 [Nitrospira sp.]|nr:hypothetical protein [Nitrospira sp.]
MRKELGLASRDFYMDKLKNLDSMTPEKQEFLIKVIKLIATNSYLAEHMQGEMPEEIKRLLDRLTVKKWFQFLFPPVLDFCNQNGV